MAKKEEFVTVGTV